MAHWMSALLAGEREVVRRRHPRAHEPLFPIDEEDLVDEEAFGPVRAIGEELGVEGDVGHPRPYTKPAARGDPVRCVLPSLVMRGAAWVSSFAWLAFVP